jgi:hypothetical protein
MSLTSSLGVNSFAGNSRKYSRIFIREESPNMWVSADSDIVILPVFILYLKACDK